MVREDRNFIKCPKCKRYHINYISRCPRCGYDYILRDRFIPVVGFNKCDYCEVRKESDKNWKCSHCIHNTNHVHV